MSSRAYPTAAQIFKELPSLRVKRVGRGDPKPTDLDGKPSGCGVYYWFGSPGCMPDSDFYGPFKSELAAIRNAYDLFGEE